MTQLGGTGTGPTSNLLGCNKPEPPQRGWPRGRRGSVISRRSRPSSCHGETAIQEFLRLDGHDLFQSRAFLAPKTIAESAAIFAKWPRGTPVSAEKEEVLSSSSKEAGEGFDGPTLRLCAAARRRAFSTALGDAPSSLAEDPKHALFHAVVAGDEADLWRPLARGGRDARDVASDRGGDHATGTTMFAATCGRTRGMGKLKGPSEASGG